MFFLADVLESHKWSNDYQFGSWIVASEDPEKFGNWCRTFERLFPIDGKLTGEVAKKEMLKSNLVESTLAKLVIQIVMRVAIYW